MITNHLNEDVSLCIKFHNENSYLFVYNIYFNYIFLGVLVLYLELKVNMLLLPSNQWTVLSSTPPSCISYSWYFSTALKIWNVG